MSGTKVILLFYVTEDIVFLSGIDLLFVKTKKVLHFLREFSLQIIYMLIGCSRENE